MLTKEQFISYMEQFKTITKKGQVLSDALKDFSVDFGGFFDETSHSLIVKLLQEVMKDNKPYPSSEIEYFVYELNWGEDYRPGCITDEDGCDVPLANLDDLYDLLIANAELDG